MLGDCKERLKNVSKIVESRDENTLHDTMSEYVEPGSMILTDSWKGCSLLSIPSLHHKASESLLQYWVWINPDVHSQNIVNKLFLSSYM